MTITRLTAEAFEAAVPELADLLVDSVAGGASVGFLAGFDHAAAVAWWRSRAAAVADGTLLVWLAAGPAGPCGTISLAYAEKPNARHRAEVLKLAVHRGARGRGLGRRLLAAAERAAAESGATLLLLDTETASAAERLYESAGWVRYGIVPDYAAGPEGALKDCSFFYKKLG
ncbi:GNAT family N-acetyltransferase [Amorphoplanes digitatis]|uniref:Ribosomal protein S18 acetylase RimI-like enzyme n=1 Tax=Actinoplanes digitatis TaxID=1868 RepID=A0A7W7HYA1_9ACTN|nr:GNAT family N-acetyltransferase [Actinoplanes digitatis]MBB4763018.1 ribosomal protein S18 acetylase RimI-like enzyme [Actinoplanes digitatis]GID95781.1 N-acetyltransferase [Actinoplanes digitatis]